MRVKTPFLKLAVLVFSELKHRIFLTYTHKVTRMEIYCTCKADIPSKQFKAMLALPGNVSGLARRNKIAMEDTVVVPCNNNN